MAPGPPSDRLDDEAPQPATDAEPRGRDRFPGGAEPLLGPRPRAWLARQRRWAGPATEFAFNLVVFGVVTSLLASWWSDDPSSDFTVGSVLVRGSVFAVLTLSISQWTKRRKRRGIG